MGHAPIAREAWSLASRTSIGSGAIATASNRQRCSRTHVAATILLIAFGLAPNIAAAQSHLPQCPSDRNQVWTDCTGIYSYPDGSRYIGEFRDNKRSGQGTLTFTNGDKYVGEWSDGKENGHGTYTFVGGDKNVGDWRDSKRNGRGTQTYSDGSSYVGEFRGDKRNGQGALTWPNRDKFFGEWRDNKDGSVIKDGAQGRGTGIQEIQRIWLSVGH